MIKMESIGKKLKSHCFKTYDSNKTEPFLSAQPLPSSQQLHKVNALIIFILETENQASKGGVTTQDLTAASVGSGIKFS